MFKACWKHEKIAKISNPDLLTTNLIFLLPLVAVLIPTPNGDPLNTKTHTFYLKISPLHSLFSILCYVLVLSHKTWIVANSQALMSSLILLKYKFYKILRIIYLQYDSDHNTQLLECFNGSPYHDKDHVHLCEI